MKQQFFVFVKRVLSAYVPPPLKTNPIHAILKETKRDAKRVNEKNTKPQL